MPRTKRDMVIAVCRVAPAHAIPDQDEDGKSASSGFSFLMCVAERRTEATGVTASSVKATVGKGEL
jgi:hypothetical protein